jgi:exopolysaccharide biosynthesis polyprenyl glycosylphosphotransferase
MSAISGEPYAARVFARTRARRPRKLVRYILLCDLVALTLAATAAVVLCGRVSTAVAVAWVGGSVVVAAAMLSAYQLYERDRQQIAVSTLDEIRDLLHALNLLALLELALGEAIAPGHLHGALGREILVFWLLGLVLLPATRGVFRHYVVPLLNTPQNAVIVGAGRVGQLIAEKIRKHPEYNLRIVGFLDDEPRPLERHLDDLPVLGPEHALVDVLRRHQVSRVILAFSRRSHDQLLEVIRNAGLRDVQLSIIPRYFEILPATIRVGEVDGMTVLETPDARLSRLSFSLKRLFELTLTILVCVLLAPLLVAIAIAIKLDSPGPVLFRQQRMGRGDRVFWIFKFRTMVDGAEAMRAELLSRNELGSGPLFKLRRDPRTTRVGKILRQWSLDELPQLFNVLRGEMSLVGPRPFVVYEDVRIDGWARRRLDLPPGITGPWQVLGRNDVPFEEMVKLDYLYVHTWSLWGDIKLLVRTIPIVFRRRGY